jgi:quercetin dioxygenase-like cupin family protein
MLLSRRLFAGCALCAGLGLVATGAEAQAPAATAGVKRTVLQRTDFPGEQYATILAIGEVDANALVARHTHPGVETGLILAGTGVLSVQGQPDRTVGPNDSFQVLRDVPHAIRNGAAPMRISSVYVVDKDQPLATPAPE